MTKRSPGRSRYNNPTPMPVDGWRDPKRLPLTAEQYRNRGAVRLRNRSATLRVLRAIFGIPVK